MIRMNDQDQCLECTICDETQEISRRTLRHPDELMIRREAMEAEHAGCEEFKHNPERARAERQYRQAMRAELAKAAQREKARA